MVSRDEFRHLAAAACWDKQQALRMCVSTWVWFCFAYVCESETVFVYVCVCLHGFIFIIKNYCTKCTKLIKPSLFLDG